MVLSVYHFRFVYLLALLHTSTSIAGMALFARAGLFTRKRLSAAALLPFALAYVAYVVLNNLSLQMNPVGFYQICKIAIAPCVLALEVAALGRRASRRVVASVALVCAGVALATVSDSQLAGSALGVAVGFGSVAVTALYQVRARTWTFGVPTLFLVLPLAWVLHCLGTTGTRMPRACSGARCGRRLCRRGFVSPCKADARVTVSTRPAPPPRSCGRARSSASWRPIPASCCTSRRRWRRRCLRAWCSPLSPSAWRRRCTRRPPRCTTRTSCTTTTTTRAAAARR